MGIQLRPNPIRIAFPILALGLVLSARTAAADWPASGLALTTAPGDQDRAHVVSDGAGGAIVTWQDLNGFPVSVFAQHVLGSGELDAAWPANGRALLTDSAALETAQGAQRVPVIVEDGGGGALIAWQDERNDPQGPDVFIQHVLASGAVDPAWPANGTALCTAGGVQDNLDIVTDGAGGAIVTWMDGRAGGGSGSGVDIYAQHVLASGAVDPSWPVNGVALCTAAFTQAFPRIASDGAGGAIVTWYDLRSEVTSVDVYAQHVSSSGSVDPAWPLNGLGIAIAPGSQSDPTIVSDGLHGAIIAWTDLRDGVQHIFAQHALGSGSLDGGWPADGVAVCTAPGDQILPIMTPDGAHGALVTWEDLRSGSNHNPFAQHVLAAGVVDAAWPVNGRALSGSSGEELSASIVGDGAGGAIVAWEEDSSIMAQHVEALGGLDPAYPVNGRFVRLSLDFENHPSLVATGGGNAIVAWSDGVLSGIDRDIYANLVTTSRTVSVEPSFAVGAVALAAPRPNPARVPLTLRYALARPGHVRLSIFDAAGRRVRELRAGDSAPGDYSATWDLLDQDGARVGAGVYFARLEAEGRTFARRIVALR